MREREYACDDREYGEIASGPRNAQSFAEPEDAEGDDDDAYSELERIFRNAGEWTMDCYPESDDYERSCGCSRCGGN